MTPEASRDVSLFATLAEWEMRAWRTMRPDLAQFWSDERTYLREWLIEEFGREVQAVELYWGE